jgi:hypothetical protein
MKRVSLSLIIIAVITAFTACVETQPSGEPPYIWGVDTVQEGDPRQDYLTANYIISKPSLQSQGFSFAFASKTPIIATAGQISMKFFCGGVEIPMVAEAISMIEGWTYLSEDAQGKYVRTEVPDHRYYVSAELTIYDVVEEIYIDNIVICFDEHERVFPVAISIKHINLNSYQPWRFHVSQTRIFRNLDETYEKYSFFDGSVRVGQYSAVLNSFSLRSMPIEPEQIFVVCVSRNDISVLDEVHTLEAGFVFEAYCEYKFMYSIDHTRLTGFYDEAIDFNVTVDGIHDITWYSNVNFIVSGMPEVAFSDASIKFFE